MPERILGGRYKVQGKIGIGGMATVYRGTDEVLGRTVAIKTMLPQYAADPSFAARFKQEAQAAAALQSPYIVGIFDWGKDGDTYYIVMEYLRGTDLKSGIRTHGALDSRKVAQIGSQICQALSVAHKHDIIHRDIKPQNIMVQPDGTIKVMDFGIARAKNSHLTADNSVLGTAHYVSPEQTQGKPLGPTSDIYSLGIVMYEASCGKVPFDGDDAISVALKQVNEQPVPPSQVNPNVDPQLEAIIMKCLMKDPQARFQTADELRRALTDYLAGRVVSVSNNATTMIPAGPTSRMNRAGGTQQMNRVSNPAGSTRVAAKVDSDDEDDEPSGGTGRKVGIVVGVIAAIALIGAIVYFALGNQSTTQSVPNYISMTQDAAVAAIEQTDFFQVGSVTQEYDDTAEEGTVIDQDPQSGTLQERGTKINLTVSKGKKPAQEVTVPSLANMTPDQAQDALSKLGLVAKAGDSVFSDSVDSGLVVSQSPAAGSTAKEGDTVTYSLSKGKDSKSVPDVRGYSESSATSTLQNAGFAVSVGNSVYSDTVDEGCVVSYTPDGEQPSGTTISLTISKGPKPAPQQPTTPTTPSNGGNSNGNNGGNSGGDTGNEGGDSGNQGGDTGGDDNQGGDTGGGTTP